MSQRVRRAFLLLSDLEAVAAAERKVAGMPLLTRTVCCLRDAGVREIVVAAPAGRQPRVDFDDSRWRAAVWGEGTEAAEPRGALRAANDEVVAATPEPPEPMGAALVLRGDLVYLPEAVDAMLAAGPGTAVTGRLGGEWRAVACVVAGAAAAASCAAVAGRGLDAAVARRPFGGPTLALLRESVLPARTPAEARRAERRLLEALPQPNEGWLARLVEHPLSLAVTGLLLRTGALPKWVASFALVLGLSAGPVAACGGWLAALLGVACVEAHAILRRAGGQLARLQHLRSRLGTWLDPAGAGLARLSFVTGLAVSLWRADVTGALVAVAVVAVAALGAKVVARRRLAARSRPTAPRLPTPAHTATGARAARLGRRAAANSDAKRAA